MLHRQAKEAMELKFSFTWQLLGALRTPTLVKVATKQVAVSLLKAKMRRGGAARGALQRRPTVEMQKRMEEETMEEEEGKTDDGSDSDSDFGPPLGELLKID
jgi:hypothetical protein